MSELIVCPERRVESAWIDYNGHMNMAYYHVLFDQALDHVFDDLGIGAAYVASGAGSCFTAEVHVAYLDELSEADPVRVSYQLLDWDEKRLHLFAEMQRAAFAARRPRNAACGAVSDRGARPHRRTDGTPPQPAASAAGRSRDRDTRGEVPTRRSLVRRSAQ
jgi:acyl-CoA thioesterase FadM